MNNFNNSKHILTVSQISQKIRNCLESQFPSLWIKGELSNFVAHSSGHWYFRLKDEQSQIKGVMFKRQNQKLNFKPQTGEEVVVLGQVTVYSPRGDYQILCHEMEIVGSGLLQQQFEQLKRKLEQEGLFEPERKKALPLYPRHIGLITSPTGAAVRDILQILNRRFKTVKVTLIPALVQGEQAPESLIKALSMAQKISPDVLIIGRGGGSMEDLWAFNNEELARAIAHQPIPIVSAVGHEIDFTICDFVADKRAPTPSSAAELVVQNREDLLEKIQNLKNQLLQKTNWKLDFLKEKLFSLDKGLIRPHRLLEEFSQRLDENSSRLNQHINQNLKRAGEQIQHLKQVLESLNPKKVMERGFSIVTDSKGNLIYNTKGLKLKETLHIDFFKGKAKAEVTEKEEGL